MWDTHHDFPLTGMTTTMTYSNLNTSVAGYYYRTYHATYGNYDLTFRIVFKVGNPVGSFRTAEKHVSYSYDDDWLDQLESYTVDIDGVSKTSAITYDNSGNPEKISNFYYENVKYHHAILSWDGRELVNIVIYNDAQELDIIAEISYTYNDQGIRIGKIIEDNSSTTKHEYKLTGDLVIAEIVSQYNNSTQEWDLSYKIAYNFDYDGSPIGFTYFVDSSKTDYIYVKNQFGDITHITLTNGYVVVQYQYDSYGNIINIDGSSQIGQYNIYRYKGYKYDKEISLYYLNSRYYNPEIGRFINADGLLGQVGNLQSTNMYAYCANNPVMYLDITGTYAVLNNYIASSHSFLNHVNKTSQSFKLIYDPYISIIFGNVSYTITESDKAASLFYTYSCVGTNSAKYGAGVNLGGWVGLYGFISTPGDFGMGVKITPWVHASGQIGLSGIGTSVGINIGNTAHDISVNVGWGTVGIFAIAILPIPGARAVAATAGLIIIVVGFVEYGDGGYYL